MSDLISEAPLMNIKNTYIYTYINNMQHYLLYIGDKTTKTNKNNNNKIRNRSILEEFTVYVFKRASIQNNRIANRWKQRRE